MHTLALGLFVFGMDSLSYTTLEQSQSWRHGSTERFGARAANQYLGPGEETVTIPGVLVPEIAGDRSAISTLQDMANQGDAHSLVLGNGEVLGSFVITELTQTKSNFVDNGVERKNDFSITLRRID